jgi:hypothetical protein
MRSPMGHDIGLGQCCTPIPHKASCRLLSATQSVVNRCREAPIGAREVPDEAQTFARGDMINPA